MKMNLGIWIMLYEVKLRRSDAATGIMVNMKNIIINGAIIRYPIRYCFIIIHVQPQRDISFLATAFLFDMAEFPP